MSTIGNRDFNIEFNDSVLETKGWYGSRYQGRQLNGSEINTFTEGDTSFGNTPVVRNVSRNIYIGDNIVSVDTNSSELNTAVPFQSSSYVQISSYITVNDDDTITQNNYQGGNLTAREGYYKAFYNDFKEGTNLSIKLLDTTANNQLSESYPVFFNQGVLHKILNLRNGGEDLIASERGDLSGEGRNTYDLVGISSTATWTTSQTVIYNNQYNDFYNLPQPSGVNGFDYMESFVNAIHTASRAGVDDRYFVTFTTGSNPSVEGTPILTTTGSFAPRLGYYGTTEILHSAPLFIGFKLLIGSSAFPLTYPGWLTPGSSPDTIPTSKQFGWFFSKLDRTSKPTILTRLSKNETLPDGLGNLPFVVLPENLHPHIKDNLLYYLDKAGVDVGNINIPSVDRKNINLT